MATVFLETPDATQALQFWGSSSGSVTYDTTAAKKKSGLASWKCDSGAGNSSAYVGKYVDVGRRLSAYFYLADLPGSTVSIAYGYFYIKVTSGGVLQLWDASAQLGSDGSTLSTGTLYRISLACNGTTVKVFLDGVEDISGSDVNVFATVQFGWLDAPGANKVLNFQHVYVDDDNSLTDTGDVRVTAKLPDELNDNNYDTTGGTGAVTERPISETNYMMHAAKASVLQDWTLETAAEGDVDISGDTLVARCAWMWAMSSKDGDTVCIVDDGDSATCWPDIDGVAQLCTKITDSASYPSNAAGIGQKSGAGAPDEYLYECGTLIAYTVVTGETYNRSCTRTGSVSISLARTAVLARSPTRVGSVNLSLARALELARGPSRTGSVSLSLAKAVTFPRAVSRVGSVSLSLARDMVMARAVSRVGSVSLSLGRVVELARSVTRTGSVSVSAAAEVIIVRTASRVGSVATSLARVVTVLRSISRTGTASTSLAKAVTFPRSVSRVGSVSVSVVRELLAVRAVSRVGSVATSLARGVTLLRSVSRTGSVSTSANRVATFLRGLSRTGSVIVSAVAEVSISRALTRTGSVATALDAIVTIGRQVTRVGSVATSLVRDGTFIRGVTKVGSVATNAAYELIEEGVEFFVGMYRRIVG